MMMMTTIITK